MNRHARVQDSRSLIKHVGRSTFPMTRLSTDDDVIHFSDTLQYTKNINIPNAVVLQNGGNKIKTRTTTTMAENVVSIMDSQSP